MITASAVPAQPQRQLADKELTAAHLACATLLTGRQTTEPFPASARPALPARGAL